MSIPNIYKELIALLINKTENGQLDWSQEHPNGFTTTIGQSNFVKIWRGADEDTDRPFISFALTDENEKTLDSWFVDYHEPDYQKMSELYDKAARISNKIETTIKKLNEILSNS